MVLQGDYTSIISDRKEFNSIVKLEKVFESKLNLGVIVVEDQGFEPWEALTSPVFKTGTFDQLCQSSM